VSEVRLPRPLDLVFAVHRVIMACEASAAYTSLLERHPGEFGPILCSTVQTGRLVPAPAYLQAQRLRQLCTAALREALEGADALLLPTATNVAPGRETTGDPALQVPATLAGFPSISLPSGLAPDGLPFAVQLIGRAGGDERLLDVAAWCEAHLDAMPGPPL
jgi:amidase